MKLERFFSNKNICSRKQFKVFLKNSSVVVNGKNVKASVELNNLDEIIVNDEKYIYRKYVYIVMNKPKGYVCANTDELNSTVFELLGKNDYQNDLFTVGRLDKNTTGLLIITNDGTFGHEISKDKKNYPKTYSVRLAKTLSNEDIQKLETGVIINKGYVTKPSKLQMIEEKEMYLTIYEGKYHQVKEMMKAVNNEVVELNRIAIGNYYLDDCLRQGEYVLEEREKIKH